MQFENSYLNYCICFPQERDSADALSGVRRLLYTIDRKVGGRLNITKRSSGNPDCRII